MKAYLTITDPNLRYGLRTGAAVVIATWLAYAFHFKAPYWSAITVIIIMTPSIGATLERSMLRIIGTFVGGFLGFAVAAIAIHSYLFFLLFVFLCVASALYFSMTTLYPYAFVVGSVTAYFMLGGLVYEPNQVFMTMIWRISEVSLGVIVAWLSAYAIFPTHAKILLEQHLQQSAVLSQDYLANILAHYDGTENTTNTINLEQQLSRHLTAAEELTQYTQIELSASTSQLVLTKRIIRAYNRLFRQLRFLQQSYRSDLTYSILKREGLAWQEVFTCLKHCLSQLHQVNIMGDEFINHVEQLTQSMAHFTNQFDQLRSQKVLKQYPVQEVAAIHSFITNLSNLTEEIQALLLALPNEKTRDRQQQVMEETPMFDFSEHSTALKLSIKGGLSAVLATLLWIFTDWPGGLQGIISAFVLSMQRNVYDSHLIAELRLFGCLLGGTLGLIVLYLFHFDTTLSLLLLFVVSSFFGYWSIKSKRYGYAALQANFAFIMATIHYPGPATSIAPALERLAGILLGILAMFIVGQLLWPTHPKPMLNQGIAKVLQHLKTMGLNFCQQKSDTATDPIKDRVAINSMIKRCYALLDTLKIYHRASDGYITQAENSLRLLGQLATTLYSMIDTIDLAQARSAAKHYEVALDHLLQSLTQTLSQLSTSAQKIPLLTDQEHLSDRMETTLLQIRTANKPQFGDETKHLFKFLYDGQQLVKLLS